MILILHKKNDVTDIDGAPVLLWKFKDENGNLWNTETAIDGTEEEAASIILGANQ